MHLIRKAADVLQVSEFRIFDEAYARWHGDRASSELISELFSRFMMYGETPDWAEKFAKDILSDVDANRPVSLNTYCLLNLAPRVGSKVAVSFSVIRE